MSFVPAVLPNHYLIVLCSDLYDINAAVGYRDSGGSSVVNTLAGRVEYQYCSPGFGEAYRAVLHIDGKVVFPVTFVAYTATAIGSEIGRQIKVFRYRKRVFRFSAELTAVRFCPVYEMVAIVGIGVNC